MPISQTPLEIEQYYVLTFRLGSNENYIDGNETDGEIDVDYGVFAHPDDRLRFQVAMSIAIENLEGKNEPYSLQLELYGYFRFKADTAEEVVKKMMFSNAVPILYGIARGYVGQATATAMNGPLVLPSYNFVALTARKVAKQREQEQQQLLTAPADEAATDAPGVVANNTD